MKTHVIQVVVLAVGVAVGMALYKITASAINNPNMPA